MVKRILAYITALGMLFLVYPLCYCPLAAHWHYKNALGYCLIGMNPSSYNEQTAVMAMPYLKNSLRYYSHSWETHFLLGLACLAVDNFPEAKKEFLLCVKYNPGYARAYYNLGNTCYRLKEYAEAVKHYEECLKIDAGFESATNNLKAARIVKKRLDLTKGVR